MIASVPRLRKEYDKIKESKDADLQLKPIGEYVK